MDLEQKHVLQGFTANKSFACLCYQVYSTYRNCILYVLRAKTCRARFHSE